MARWLLWASLLGVTLAGLCPAVAALSQGDVLIRIDALDSSQFPRIQATVTVVDASGRPVADLPPDAFGARAADIALPVSEVASATDEGLAIAVTLAFDVSGSMSGLPLEQAKQAGKALLEELGPEDQAAALAFADEAQVVQPFTRDRQALAVAIDGLAAQGNTALYDAVSRSLQIEQAADSPRRAVVLLSDGQDYGGLSQIDRGTSLSVAAAAGVPVFVVGLGELVDQAYLDELAKTTRGQLWLAPGPEALQDLYKTIGSLLRHQYVLTLDGSALISGPSSTLRIEVSHSGAVAYAEARLDVPLAPLAASPPAVVPSARPVSQPVAEKDEPASAGGGGLNWLLGLMASAALGVLLVVAVSWWRYRRRQEADRGILPGPATSRSVTPVLPVGLTPSRPVPPAAWLRLVSPRGDEAYPLGDSPLTIGFTADCGIRLPDVASTRWERVRVWRREARYMFHNLSRFGDVSVGGRPTTWAILEDGDEIQIGSWRLSFHEGAPPTDGGAKF